MDGFSDIDATAIRFIDHLSNCGRAAAGSQRVHATDAAGVRRAVRSFDLPWTTFTAKLIHQSRATVVPICFNGRNSRLFQIASHIGEPIRVALLIREILNTFGSTVHLDIGQTIPYADLAHLNRVELTSYLHDVMLALKS